MADLALRPLARADLPLLASWLAVPHVRARRGAPEAECAACRRAGFAEIGRRRDNDGRDVVLMEYRAA